MIACKSTDRHGTSSVLLHRRRPSAGTEHRSSMFDVVDTAQKLRVQTLLVHSDLSVIAPPQAFE